MICKLRNIDGDYGGWGHFKWGHFRIKGWCWAKSNTVSTKEFCKLGGCLDWLLLCHTYSHVPLLWERIATFTEAPIF